MTAYVLFVLGLILLVKCADWFVDGSIMMARKWGVSNLVIGLTIVAFGTSVPETFVNVLAAIQGTPGIAFGNIIGSNMANILLILGLSATISPIRVQVSTVWKEIPFSLLAAVMLLVISYQNNYTDSNMLNQSDGLLLLGVFAIFLYYVYTLSSHEKQMVDVDIQNHQHSNVTVACMVLGGLIGLYVGGKWTVEGAVFIATRAGLSQYLISATIIALGTSLPELVTCVIAARKKAVDLAVGNVVGSNIFNILFVMGITPLIAPIPVPSVALDLALLIFATMLLFAFLFIGKKHYIDRWQGVVLVSLYVIYLVFLVIRG